MKIFLNALFALLFASALTLSAAAQGQDPSGTSTATKNSAAPDSHFIKNAAEGGLAEVELGQLAVQKASSPQVKQFGQRMVDDHTKANAQLQQVAGQQKVDLPQQPSAKDRALKMKLEKLSGTQFDQAYMTAMVKDHKKDVAEFQKESQTGKDSAVKSFAQQTLPTLQEHLQQAQQIAPSQRAEQTGGSQQK